MRRFAQAIAVVLLGMALAASLMACASRPATPLELTRQDNGSTRTLGAGQELRISLDSNPTTGYRWALDGALPPQLEQVGEPRYDGASTALGAGGTDCSAIWR